MKKFFLAVGVIAGTIIGAGIFSLPYIFTELGLLTGFFYLLIFAGIYYFIHSYYLEILRSEKIGDHHFSYFAKKYLSKFWGSVSSGLVVLELVFSLTIYLILSRIFAGLVFGGTSLWFVVIFWFLGSLFIFAKDRFLGWAEFFGGLGILVIIIFVLGGGEGGGIEVSLVNELSLFDVLIPFGPLLFAFAGRAAISKVVDLGRGVKDFPWKKVIFWGTFLPIFVYMLFVFGVLRVTPDVSVDALSSLSGLPSEFLLGIGLIGLLTLWTSYVVIGGNVYDILDDDAKGKKVAFLVAVFSPLVLYLIGLNDFLSVISITGGVFLAVEAIFVITIWLKMKDGVKSLIRPVLLYLVFLISIIYQVLNVLGVSI